MNASPGSRERLVELLCDRALEGLEPHEANELAQLVALHRGGLEDQSYELAAAAVTLSVPDPGAEPLPTAVMMRLYAAAGIGAPQQPRPGYGQVPQQQQPFGQPTPQTPQTAANAPTVVSPMPPQAIAPAATQVAGTPSPGGVAGMPPVAPGPPQPPPQAQPAQVVPFPYRPEAAPPSRRERRSDPLRWLGWLAAAACLAVAIGGWWPKPPREVARVASLDVPRIELPPPPPISVADRREALLRDAKDAVKVEWTPGNDDAAKAAAGDVVWSNSAQRGYMTFRGLEPNDPTKDQYQLWIFDEEQDKRYPIDGGVFDIDPSGNVVVEIDPSVVVKKPTLFAITVEKPGGVVVSKRERVVLTAEVKG